MQANNTTTAPITQIIATQDGPQWITIQPATQRAKVRPIAQRTAQDAVYQPEDYKAWLQRMTNDQWQDLFGQHSPAEFAQAIEKCRYFKRAKAKYDAAGKPATWQPRLTQVYQQMQATLKGMHFADARALWAAYQWSTYRDPNGHSPDHGAHIASVEHYQWLEEVTRTSTLDGSNGGYTSPYQCNADDAVESARYHGTPYAITDDAENPAHRLDYVTSRIAHLTRQQRPLPTRIRKATVPARKAHLAAKYNDLARQLRELESEAEELAHLLTTPTDADGMPIMDDQAWINKIAYDAADVPLQRSAPAAPHAQIIDVFNTAAETTDQIAGLRKLQRRETAKRDYFQGLQASGTPLTRLQQAMLAEADALIPVITASIHAHAARLQA